MRLKEMQVHFPLVKMLYLPWKGEEQQFTCDKQSCRLQKNSFDSDMNKVKKRDWVGNMVYSSYLSKINGMVIIFNIL